MPFHYLTDIYRSEVEPVVTSSDGVGMVAYLRVKKASLVPKTTTPNAQCTVPPMLDHKYSEIEKVVEQLLPGSLTTGAVIRSSITHPIASSCLSRRIGNWVSVSGAEANNLGDVESEAKACFELISGERHIHWNLKSVSNWSYAASQRRIEQTRPRSYQHLSHQRSHFFYGSFHPC